MDYGRFLVLYSGGADSTHFIENESSALHLIHYESRNEAQTKLAVINANILNRFITVVSGPCEPRDGETNQIHALYDTQMAIDAGIQALSFGMSGIVMCFNADDIGIDFESVERILRRVSPTFKLLLPLREITASQIRSDRNRSELKSISCMYSAEPCGFCAKCKKGR
jgi:hypothetical protein